MVGRTAIGGRRSRVQGYLRWHLAAGVLLMGILAGTLAGCDLPGMGGVGGASSTGAQIPSVTISANEMSFDIPASLSASGLMSITMNNQGRQPHQINLARLNDGVTQDQLTNALKTNLDQALAMITFVGGPNTVDPGQSQTAIVDMAPGAYLAACFLPDTANPGKTHVGEGMYKYFTVPQPSGPAPAEPQDNGLVTLHDFSIELPAASPFHTGQVTWKVWNHGGQPHEMALIKLAAGKTEQDAIAFLEQQTPSGPPPFSDAGGIGGLGLDKSDWAMLNLTAGDYVALCYVPDPSTGRPHFMLGMHQAFTVQ